VLFILALLVVFGMFLTLLMEKEELSSDQFDAGLKKLLDEDSG
jgi:hypothetical protein